MSAPIDADPAPWLAHDAESAAKPGASGESRWRRLLGSRARSVLIGAVVALAGVVGGVFYWTHGADIASKAVVVDLDVLVLHPLPEILTDLSDKGRPAYVKLAILVQIAERHLPELVANEDQIVDAVQTRLRQYQRSELMGQAGSERLRADVLSAVNRAIQPAVANDVLFRELLVN
ncbi:MAG: flagellar basal body-associated FliL family protein [Rhodospirillales bacterium]|nr:flagellar basal body-associated FliL family protein [Rhodospirillales bacterium]